MASPHQRQLTFLGTTDFRNQPRSFGIAQRDRLMHTEVIGKSGQGKSTLLKNLIANDLGAGRGLLLLDPHGDLVDAVLGLVPESRIADTIYVNPADADFPIAFNPLDVHDGTPAHLVASGVIAALKKTWPRFFGPRMENV